VGVMRKRIPFIMIAAIVMLAAIFILVPYFTYHVNANRVVKAGTASPIKHIVFMVKENQTFDSLFGTFAGRMEQLVIRIIRGDTSAGASSTGAVA
jgi:phospholipase C